MKRYLTVCLFFVGTSVCNGQSFSQTDSLEIMEALDKVFKSFENPHFSEFRKISTEEIMCFICEDASGSERGSYTVERKSFFDKYLMKIKGYDSWKRASISKEFILHKPNSAGVDIIVFLRTWNKNEYAPGNEGAQLGIYFLKVKGVLKFSGMETIP